MHTLCVHVHRLTGPQHAVALAHAAVVVSRQHNNGVQQHVVCMYTCTPTAHHSTGVLLAVATHAHVVVVLCTS